MAKPGTCELYAYVVKDRDGAPHTVHKVCVASAEADAMRHMLVDVPPYDQSWKNPVRYDGESDD